jgi:hypothetical protein
MRNCIVREGRFVLVTMRNASTVALGYRRRHRSAFDEHNRRVLAPWSPERLVPPTGRFSEELTFRRRSKPDNAGWCNSK